MTDLIKIEIEGTRYRLIAEIQPRGSQADFILRAIHKATGRTSVVNQVNAILTVFFAENFPDDWPWTASWDRVMHWMKTFAEIAKTSALSSWNQLTYLEDQLDADRSEGEWANVVADRMTELAQEFLDDEDSEEMRNVLADADKLKAFVEWLNNDQGQWLVDNWNSWREHNAEDDDETQDSSVRSNFATLQVSDGPCYCCANENPIVGSIPGMCVCGHKVSHHWNQPTRWTRAEWVEQLLLVAPAKTTREIISRLASFAAGRRNPNLEYLWVSTDHGETFLVSEGWHGSGLGDKSRALFKNILTHRCAQCETWHPRDDESKPICPHCGSCQFVSQAGSRHCTICGGEWVNAVPSYHAESGQSDEA